MKAMATADPLVISYSSDQTTPASSLDETMEMCIGHFSWSQFLQSLLVSIAWIFDAQQTFMSVFTDAVPSWHCIAAQSICSPAVSSLCSIPRDSWAWDYLPVHTSIVSQWELQCASTYITGIPASAFFAGCLTGGLLFATLADSSLGRKNMLLLSCLIMSATSLLTAFSTNLWIYSLLRFICGVGRATVGTCSLVLASELVGRRWRGHVAILGFFCFTLGFLSLPSLAYMNMGCTWRNMYLLTSIPTLFYCIFVKLAVHESPIWLFIKGRREDAISTLKSLMSGDVSSTTIFETLVSSEHQEADNNGNGTYSSMKTLFAEKSWALRRLLAVMIAGFGIGIMYYGMPLGLANLSFSLYLSVTLNALAELPASLLTFLMIGKLNRRASLLCFTLMSGAFSTLSVGVAPGGLIQMGLEMISFFSACASFNMILIYTLELFPTCVRNSAMSMVRQALVFGGVFSPLLVAAGRGDNGVVTVGVFGLLISLCGLFVACLPETRGGRLCDTWQEEETKHLTMTNEPY